MQDCRTGLLSEGQARWEEGSHPGPGAWGGAHLWHCWAGGGRSFESVVYEIIYELTRAGVCITQALTTSAFHLPPFVQVTPQPGTFLELVALADPHFQFSLCPQFL